MCVCVCHPKSKKLQAQRKMLKPSSSKNNKKPQHLINLIIKSQVHFCLNFFYLFTAFFFIYLFFMNSIVTKVATHMLALIFVIMFLLFN